MMNGQKILNESFICELCGAHDLVPSRITLEANYGSRYDGDMLTVEVCGECLDKLLESVWQLVEQRKKEGG